MKRLTTIVFASLIALTLTVPAWSQSGTSTTQSTTKKNPPAKKASNKATKKATKKAAKKTTKKAGKTTTKNPVKPTTTPKKP